MKSNSKRALETIGMMVVSIDSASFLAKGFFPLIIPILANRHSLFYIIIADALMVYNRYAINLDAQSLKQLFHQHYWIDRKKKIDQVIKNENLQKKVKVHQYNDFCNKEFADVYRKFYRLTLSDRRLINAIGRKAAGFIRSMRKKTISKSRSEVEQVVKTFLVEETAWALHMAANFGITDQYYPGDNASLLHYVYSYKNKKQLMTLIGIKPHVHRFWNFSINGESLLFDKSSWEGQVENNVDIS